MKTLMMFSLPTLTILMMSCSSESARVSRIAEQAMQQQSRQNEEMARLNREIAVATERLVEADAEARQEILAAHQALVNQRDVLEAERRQIAAQRVRVSWLAPLVSQLGMLALCLLPVAVALLALRQPAIDDAELLNDILIQEFVSADSRLLGARLQASRLTHASDESV